MTDIYSKKRRSEIMSKIKSRGTLLEERGWKILKKNGVRFRKHPKGVKGNPDAENRTKKIVFFSTVNFGMVMNGKKQGKKS